VDEYITVKEAAARKDVTESAISKAIRENRLPATSILGRVALRPEDVDRYEFGSYGEHKRTSKPRGTGRKKSP
jgi:excisionase family DNA binding protein